MQMNQILCSATPVLLLLKHTGACMCFVPICFVPSLSLPISQGFAIFSAAAVLGEATLYCVNPQL